MFLRRWGDVFMPTIVEEKNGTRKFERITCWNKIDETLITRKSIHAPYADNPDSKGEKLFLTYFKLNNHITPLNKFGKLMTAVTLSDRSVISRQDTETGYFMEVNSSKDKVRLYKEIL